jgi:hypothetical protein
MVSLLVLTAVSCQPIIYCVIENRSSETIIVEYTLKERTALIGGSHFPAKKTLNELGDFDIAWRELPPGQYVYDEQRTVSVSLSPGEALRVADISESPRSDRGLYAFGIESIRIKASRGNIEYSGIQTPMQFRRSEDGVYSITYY